jgi:hypothetical protein
MIFLSSRLLVILSRQIRTPVDGLRRRSLRGIPRSLDRSPEQSEDCAGAVAGLHRHPLPGSRAVRTGCRTSRWTASARSPGDPAQSEQIAGAVDGLRRSSRWTAPEPPSQGPAQSGQVAGPVDGLRRLALRRIPRSPNRSPEQSMDCVGPLSRGSRTVRTDRRTSRWTAPEQLPDCAGTPLPGSPRSPDRSPDRSMDCVGALSGGSLEVRTGRRSSRRTAPAPSSQGPRGSVRLRTGAL